MSKKISRAAQLELEIDDHLNTLVEFKLRICSLEAANQKLASELSRRTTQLSQLADFIAKARKEDIIRLISEPEQRN